MTNKKIKLQGKYGLLEIAEPENRVSKNGVSCVRAFCKGCKKIVFVKPSDLKSGRKKSCGKCWKKLYPHTKTHGLSKTKMYRRWLSMKNRCRNPKTNNYKNYGGRGITVCDRWANSFEEFAKDIGTPPTTKHSVERIDNDGNYTPENCRWATRKEQGNNTRKNVRITYDGRTQTLQEWAQELGIQASTLNTRMKKYGWSIDKVLNIPVNSLQARFKYSGRGYRKKRNKYEAYIGINGKHVYLGVYNTEKQARSAYVKAKKEIHGEQWTGIELPSIEEAGFIPNSPRL